MARETGRKGRGKLGCRQETLTVRLVPLTTYWFSLAYALTTAYLPYGYPGPTDGGSDLVCPWAAEGGGCGRMCCGGHSILVRDQIGRAGDLVHARLTAPRHEHDAAWAKREKRFGESLKAYGV
jgi:hypothetical protein